MSSPNGFIRVAAFSRVARDLTVWFDADPTEWRLVNVPAQVDEIWRQSPDMTEFYREHIQGLFPVMRWTAVAQDTSDSLIIRP